MRVPLSILDLAPIARGQSASDSFAGSVALAQRAEELGYLRVWYAEHHNMASIASSATSVLIAHVGAQTRSIRLGAGGVMLPNHAPLTDRGAVRHPGRHVPGTDRPRPGPGAGLGSEHDVRAAPRPELGRHLPAGRRGAAGLSHRQYPGAGGGRDPRQGLARPAVHPGFVVVRGEAGRRARPALRVRLALRAGRARSGPRRSTGASSGRPGSWNGRTRSRAST